jgi:hypothetical protein
MDPVLSACGFTTHPCCDPDEESPSWPPLTEEELTDRLGSKRQEEASE